MVKTLLIGNFGAQNIGDELILSMALDQYPDSIVMTSDPQFSKTFTEKEFETISMPPTGVRSFFKDLICTDTKSCVSQQGIEQIIFPGGGLFAITPKAYLIWGKVIDWCAKNFPEVPIILEHQGFDEPKNLWEINFLCKALSKVNKVTVRDKESAEVVQKYSDHNPEIVGDRVETLRATSHGYKPQATSHKLLLVNAMKPYNKEVVQQKFPDHKIQELAFGKGDLGKKPKTKTELFTLLQKADVMVGERFHSLVLGQAYCLGKTYLLSEPYSTKVKNWQKRFDLSGFLTF